MKHVEAIHLGRHLAVVLDSVLDSAIHVLKHKGVALDPASLFLELKDDVALFQRLPHGFEGVIHRHWGTHDHPEKDALSTPARLQLSQEFWSIWH